MVYRFSLIVPVGAVAFWVLSSELSGFLGPEPADDCLQEKKICHVYFGRNIAQNMPKNNFDKNCQHSMHRCYVLRYVQGFTDSLFKHCGNEVALTTNKKKTAGP